MSPSPHTIDADALRHVCPNLSAGNANIIAAGLGDAFHRFEINTERRAAMAVAQWAHECDRFRTAEEYASGDKYENRRDLGNTQAGDGRRFKGRGRVQITGRANYVAVARALDLDCVRYPQLLARSPNAELASGWWWKSHDCNVFCDRNDFVGLTRRINGGTNGLADRQALHALARQVGSRLQPRALDPLAVLTDNEREHAEIVEHERRVARRNGGWQNVAASHLENLKKAKAWLRDQRKSIWRNAEAEPNGWNKSNRRERYRILRQLTS